MKLLKTDTYFINFYIKKLLIKRIENHFKILSKLRFFRYENCIFRKKIEHSFMHF